MIDADDRTVHAQRCGVEEPCGAGTRLGNAFIVSDINEPHDHRAATCAGSHLFQRGTVVGDEPGLQHEVFGRVTRQGQFRKRH